MSVSVGRKNYIILNLQVYSIELLSMFAFVKTQTT